ncbi:hypothetical protein BKA70DRAFT_1395317 [Coprinopsis sp. MPI-PUGE-AT-0042]|nr:hypothetical protein BKA70DRAFT_1395317 [Coprinopsis sp. MPI-PUGE-AT-0042]
MMHPMQTISLFLLALAAAPGFCSPLPLPVDSPENPPPMPPGVIRRGEHHDPAPSRILARSLGHDSLALHPLGARDWLDLNVDTKPLTNQPAHGHEDHGPRGSQHSVASRHGDAHLEPRRDPLSGPLPIPEVFPKDQLPAPVTSPASRRDELHADELVFNINPRPLLHLRSPDSNVLENLSSSNAYSGAAGNAAGGSVSSLPLPNGKAGGLLGSLNPGGGSLISLFSGNAGNGGQASSGGADAPGRGGKFPGSKFVKKKGKNGITTLVPIDGLLSGNSAATINDSAGNTFSGAGGNAAGGSVNTPPSLIDLFSHNAGSAGIADSGLSRALKRSGDVVEKRDTQGLPAHLNIDDESQNLELYPRSPAALANPQTGPKMPVNAYPMSSSDSSSSTLAIRSSRKDRFKARLAGPRKMRSRITSRRSFETTKRVDAWMTRPRPDLSKMGQDGPRRIRYGAPVPPRPAPESRRRFARRALSEAPFRWESGKDNAGWPVLSPWPLDGNVGFDNGSPTIIPNPGVGRPDGRLGEGWMEWLQKLAVPGLEGRMGWISRAGEIKVSKWISFTALPVPNFAPWRSLASFLGLPSSPSSSRITPQGPLAAARGDESTANENDSAYVQPSTGANTAASSLPVGSPCTNGERCGAVVEGVPMNSPAGSLPATDVATKVDADQCMCMWARLYQWLVERIRMLDVANPRMEARAVKAV